MKLLLKNNLTVFHPVELRGSGGTGVFEVLKVVKKKSNSKMASIVIKEQYVNAQTLSGQIYGGTGYPTQNDVFVDYANLSANSNNQ